jgi:hypothetical protein
MPTMTPIVMSRDCIESMSRFDTGRGRVGADRARREIWSGVGGKDSDSGGETLGLEKGRKWAHGDGRLKGLPGERGCRLDAEDESPCGPWGFLGGGMYMVLVWRAADERWDAVFGDSREWTPGTPGRDRTPRWSNRGQCSLQLSK